MKDQRRFLEDIATHYKFYGDTHTAFLGRFTPENVDKQNNKLGLTWTKADNDEQKIREELQKIYNVLRENGCDIPETKRGRSKKGESPWERAYAWLWQDKFPEWQILHAEKEKPDERLDLQVDWQEICRENLPLKKDLTSNELASDAEFRRKIDQVYVSLALVERRVKQERRQDGFLGQPESKEEEKLVSISQDSFFEEVLRLGRGESKGRRVAIIGEPGAGKTTRLQKIADWILDEKLGLPIWVSLGDLNLHQLTVCQYLQDVWLKNAGENLTIDVLTAQKEYIWLLLDGLDEMTSRIEKGHVLQLLTGWVVGVRVVVTCRVNVWEANTNAFLEFDVFRNLPFEPEQVESFIQKWFGDISSLAESLITALWQPRQDRLRELVRNPLCLTLLCHIWDGSALPETQAELYGEYVKKFYSWNQNLQELRNHAKRCGTNITILKKQLHDKLGELAKAALNRPEEGFHLSQSLVEEYLGEEDDQESLCYLALWLGWLNRTGRDNRGHIFAFYHATFQEYFAALRVEDWDYFLPRDHKNSPVEEREYRIFEPQWKQVILLWLGRDQGVMKDEKESFINKLVSFDPGCENGNFYYYHAYFLAAVGINEFKACSLTAEIVRKLIKGSFGYFNAEKHEWQTFLYPIEKGARQTISKTIRQLTIVELIEVIKYEYNNSYAHDIFDDLLYILGEIAHKNLQAIKALVCLLENINKTYGDYKIADILCKIDPGNPQAIAALIRIMETDEDENTRFQAAYNLLRIDQKNTQVFTVLVRIMEANENEDTCWWMAYGLGEVGQGNSQAIAVLIRILETIDDENTRLQAAHSLGEIDRENFQAITVLIRILETTKDDLTRQQAADSLGKIAQGSLHAIAELIRILEITENEDTSRETASSLGKIAQGNSQAIAALIRILEITENEDTRWQAADSLGKIDKGNPQAIAELINILETTDNEFLCWQAADSLGKIDKGNLQAIAKLTHILEATNNESLCWLIASSLGEMGQGNFEVITALIKIVETTNDEDTCKGAARSLGEIAKGNSQAIAALISMLETTEYESIRWHTADSLPQILATPEQYAGVISALKDCLSDDVHQNNFDRFESCYKVLWECAANLPYPDFHHAWHSIPE